MMHYYYCIYRKDYLYKGLVLYESMKKHDGSFKFFLICMDDESLELLNKMKLIDLIPVSIRDIEVFDTRIPELKGQRGEKTYIWTAKASAALYIFDKYKEVDHVIWVDGDTEFLSNPEPIYEEWKDYSVLLTAERFVGEYEYLGHMVGFYNTGFMGFKRDEIGIKCLEYFRERLQEWKNSEEEQGNWNDQLYVDDWLVRFPKVGVTNHDGINLTPFIAGRINEEQHSHVNIKDGIPHIKDTPIVLYHFMALKYYDGNDFDLCYYWMKFDHHTINELYIPYFKKCNEAYSRIREIAPEFYPYLSMKDKYVGNYFNLELNTSEPVYNLCTLAEEKQLVQTLCLYDSIKKYNIKFKLWICCVDENTYNTLRIAKLPEVQLFEPSNLIEDYNQLKKKGYHASIEILKSRLINQILLNNYNIESLLYVDSNFYFHQNPVDTFDMLKKNSITLFEDASALRNGFNATNTIIGFYRDKTVLDCVFYWVEKTKEWLEHGVNSMEEIAHINSWKHKYSKVKVKKSLAYSLDDTRLERVKIRKINSIIYVNEDALVLYKYNIDQVKESSIYSFVEQKFNYAAINKKQVYLPYLKSIRSSLDLLHKIGHM
ncbi:MAG: putative Glycosyltransferase [Clostridiales bacterium]|nr:putative Glycosyltransferase [Clostridiales bacterium]